MNHLLEGGNVFKNFDGTAATQRIARADVEPTVKWLEKITGLSLSDNMLGTTGRNETSGDLDLAVDDSAISKDVLINQLIAKGFAKSDIKKTGDAVHLKTPIAGDSKLGYVQTDFMFGKPAWQKFSLQGGAEGSKFKGAHRNILLASIAKSLGYKWSPKHGLVDRASNDVVSQDPESIARLLVAGEPEDLSTVETIVNKIKSRPDYEQLVADAKQTLARDGLALPGDQLSEGSIAWFSALGRVIQ